MQQNDSLADGYFKERYADLNEYLSGFGYTCAVMQGPAGRRRDCHFDDIPLFYPY